MLEAIGLACMRGERSLFRDLSFRLDAGGVLWVSGENGAGKTSLLRMLCGISRPAAGEIRWGGELIEQVRDEFHGTLAYLGHLHGLKPDLTAEENLRYLLRGQCSATRIAAQLRAGGLSRCMGLPTRVLSQGQKRRVALARVALSQACALWVLDEPFAALDRAAMEDLASLIAAHTQRQGMVVMTSHQQVDLKGVRTSRVEIGASVAAA